MTFRFSNLATIGKASGKTAWDANSGASGKDACGSTSYHNGGVEGSTFSKWYDSSLASKFGDVQGKDTAAKWLKDTIGKGSDGTGKGSDGTGKGSDGTGKGSDGTGKGSDGTGKGSDGTGKGSVGTGKGSGGTGGGSDGTGKGSGGTGGGSDGTGKGSGGTGGGSDGTGKGSGGTGGGSDGTGKGSGGTGGGSDGTGKGSGGTSGSEEPGPEKVTYNFSMGNPNEITVEITETPQGQLFVKLSQIDYDNEPADIDGFFFNLSDDSSLQSLNFFPDENDPKHFLTDIQAEADGVDALPNGASAGGKFDVGLQFGTEADTAHGSVTQTAFTLWSDDGPLKVSDLDTSGMRVVVNSENGNGELLGVNSSEDLSFVEPEAETESTATAEDFIKLMTVEVEEDDVPMDATDEEEMEMVL